MSVLTQAANSYQFYATNNPIITNSVTGFLIASIGDVLCQKALDSWEKKRIREKKSALLPQPSQKEFNYFDVHETDKVHQLASKIVRGPLKSQDTTKQLLGQVQTKTVVKRNFLQNVLLPNRIKKSASSLITNDDKTKAKQLQMIAIAEEKPFVWDSIRTIHLGVIRALVIAPFVQWWYPILLRTFPGKGMLSVAGRVVMDQLSGSPLVVVMVFVASGILQGNPTSSIQRIKEIGFSTWVRGLQYWPLVHTIMHKFIPLQHQTLFAHFCSLYWNAVLSYYVNLKME